MQLNEKWLGSFCFYRCSSFGIKAELTTDKLDIQLFNLGFKKIF